MKTTLRLLLTALIGASAVAPALAQVEGPPKRIDYQGRVLDSAGQPLAPSTPTNYTMQFRIYSTQSGGAAIWSESQTVTVSNGNFSVRIGEGIAIGSDARGDLAAVFNGKDRFLGLTVIIPGQTPGEVTPRLSFLASPFSFVADRARTADAVAQPSGTSTLGTTTVAALTVNGSTRVNGTNTLEFGVGIAGKQTDAGKIGYGTFTTGTLDIVGAGSNVLGTDRKIKLWAEGGLAVQGPTTLSGNVSIPPASNLSFGASTRQMINLFNTDYGIGVQASTLYARAGNGFAWFAGGVHNDSQNAPGTGGTLLGTLDGGGMNLSNGALRARRINANTGGFSNVLINAQATTDDWLAYWVNPTGAQTFSVGREGDVYAKGSFSTPGTVAASGSLSGANLSIGGRANIGGGGFGQVSTQIRQQSGDVVILGLQNTAAQETFAFWGDGRAFKISGGGNGWSIYSDERLKRNIKDLSGSLDRLLQLRSVQFEFLNPEKYGKGTQTGFIAQEVEKVFPEWVSDGADGMKALTVNGFESLVVQALRELRAEKDREIKARDAEIAELKKQVTALTLADQKREDRIARMESMLLPQLVKDGAAQPVESLLPKAPVPVLQPALVNASSSTPLKTPAGLAPAK